MANVRSWSAAALVVTVLFGSWNSGASAAKITTVAKTGDRASGSGGAVFAGDSDRSLGNIGDPLVNGAGEVAFWARLKGKGVSKANNEGIWAGRPKRLALVARTGSKAPDTGGAVFAGDIDGPLLNGAGVLAFGASLRGSGVTDANDEGMWLGKPGNLVSIARKGDPAPGTSGLVFDGFNLQALNGAGELAFFAFLKGSGVIATNDQGIWTGRPGNLNLVAREGDAAPSAGGAVFSEFKGLVLNGAGDLAFFAFLEGAGITTDNDEGIWMGKPGSLALVAREGDAAPGVGSASFGLLPSKDVRISLGTPALNGAGEVAFKAFRTGSGLTADVDDEGIWVGKPGSLVVAARTGDAAPGSGGANFGGFLPLDGEFSFNGPALNGAGELAFKASTTKDVGIWAGKPGSLVLAASTSDPAPGTGGLLFGFFKKDIQFDFSDPSLNGAGEVAFVAGLRFTDRQNDIGIWAGVPGNLQLIVRESDRIRVSRSDVRRVKNRGIGFNSNTGNEEGRSSSFSEGGQVAFGARFGDDSRGVFLSPPGAPKVHLLSHRPVSGAWDQVILPRSFKKPVIIAGPPGSRDNAPGVLRLRQIDGANGRFEARFQEWDYLDGTHPEERTDFLALEKGRQRQADRSIWEAGTVKVTGNRGWKRKRFKQRFPQPPEVFATVQSFRDEAAIAARVRNVTRTGFEVSIQEEETGLAGSHSKETVGYLAVYSKKGKGTIAGGVDGTKYRLKQPEVGDSFKRVLGQHIKLEEEQSQDAETAHASEAVSVMTLGRGLFAQQASDRERDTTAIRRR